MTKGSPIDSIIVSIRFSYDSRSEKRSLPNDLRRVLMGIEHNRTIFNLPKEVEKKFDSEVIRPYQFSLIKDPHTYTLPDGTQKRINTAVGVIVIYRYLGDQNLLDQTVKLIDQLMSENNREKKLDWQCLEIIVGNVIVS